MLVLESGQLYLNSLWNSADAVAEWMPPALFELVLIHEIRNSCLNLSQFANEVKKYLIVFTCHLEVVSL